MAEASILSSKPKRKDINKYRELDDEWYSLGTELEIEDDELDDLEEKYSDPHKRLIKMFGGWLEKGENPTYRKLLNALVSIDKRAVAESICTGLGLGLSLGSLLKTTSQAQEIDTRPSESVAELSSDSTVPHSMATHYQSRSDSSHISDSTHHSRAIDKSTSMAPCGGTISRELNQSKIHMQSSDTSTKDQVQDPITSASVDSSSERAYKTIVRSHDKLVTALSNDIITMSGILLAKEFISAEISSKMLLPNYIPQEKATILVNAVIDKIKIAPNRFDELIKIFSEQTCTKDVISSLASQVRHVHEQGDEDDTQDCGTEVISNGQQYTVCEGHMYTAWVSLNPADKIDLEARLIDDAEAIREEFALLCWRVRDSFEQRGIRPLTLASALLDLTISEESSNGNSGIPLLKQKEEALMSAKSVHDIFHVLRPHMNFFNYEILQFLIKGKGSKEDKTALSVFLKKFEKFCKRHVFEVPFTVYSNGQSSDNPIVEQRFHVKVTRLFKAALLTQVASKSVLIANDGTQVEKICSNKLGVNLEDAKNIQRKFAKILKLKPSSLFLDCISEGSVILTFLLPMCVSLAGLDHNPEIVPLSSNGIVILCGPPDKPERKELIPNGITVGWSPPEYGCDSLRQYVVYYRMKCEHETSEWQKIELSSLETHACVPNLSDGNTYVFKICTVSDVGTLQYSNESDPIILYNSEISVKDIYTVITTVTTTCHEMITLALSLADTHKVATSLLAKKIKHGAVMTFDSKPSDQTMISSPRIHTIIKSEPEKFREFLSILSESPLESVVEAIQSVFYRSVCSQYAGCLKFLYASLHSKHTSSDHWPPSVTQKFFRLAMIKAGAVKRGHIDDDFLRMTITGKVDDILRQKYPIELKDIFLETPGKRKVILLEGAPGCGKSTLSVYICQQWEKGQLFNQFQLVILVRLRDPAVQSAKCLADLLPCPDTDTAQLLAGIMMERNCHDVLFLLDGWDELPHDLRKKSIFDDLVNSKLSCLNPLSKSTAIVTSRPISSGDLYPHVSSRVEILGFTPEELQQFFTECLKGDAEAVEILSERIDENPEVAGSCSLPLNATILVHLFKSDCNTLPTTLYGIFSSLVLRCIKRHLKLRTQYKDSSIESLDQLPEFLKKPFSVLCQLAYIGVMVDKIIFTSLSPDIVTLSLLQGVESFIGRDKTVSHNFIHLSIQELLAAWYIATQLPASEQVSKFNNLFDKSRFSAIFRFYAAITKLKTPGIKNVVLRMSKTKIKSLLVSLLHCLYEAQDSSLCESVVQQLKHGLYLGDTTLTSSDCLCIGYFLTHVRKMAACEFKVTLRGCNIGDQACKYLISGLHKCLDTQSALERFNLDMESNIISHHGVPHLSTLLKIGCINFLDLSYNILLSEQDHTANAPFCIFAEQLENNTTLRSLRLQGCGLNSQSAESLAKALTTNKHLEELNINNNALCDDGIQHLARALRVNQSLKELRLISCCITDVGLEYLAQSLQYNTALNHLLLWNLQLGSKDNIITEKVVPVLTECLQNNHTLTLLELPRYLKSSTTVSSIENTVNDVRKRSSSELLLIGVSVWGE